MTTVEEPSRQEEAPQPNKKSNGGKRKAGLLLLLLIIGFTVAAFYWVIKAKTHIATDNAFIEAHIFPVSSRVSGVVTSVHVSDNQRVEKGDILLELDQRDYQVKVGSATAALGVARNETSEEYAAADGARAALAVARTKLDQADLDLKRGKALLEKEVIPREHYDRLETARRVAAAQVREAEEKVRGAQAVIGAGTGSNEARIAQKSALLEEARLQLSYTRIPAAASGYITRKSVEPGTMIQAGQPLMALVALEEPWIVANYKERQLTDVKPGQKVEVEVDAYPGRKFTGRVDSIMAGTGAAFSLLPPENATGNYVKVVQRIPVKITIDKSSDPQHLLRVGMSVTPVILTGGSSLDVLKKMFSF